MKKFLEWLFLLFLILVAIVLYSKDWFIKATLESAVTTLTGFETEIRNLQFDLTQGIVHLKDLKIYNPEEFERRVFAHIPEIYIRADLPALLRKERVHFYDIRFDVREINVEKNEKGISNVALLSSIAKRKEEAMSPASQPTAEKAALPFYLERLELTLRKVNYLDRSSLIQNKVSVDLNIEDHIFTGIKDPKAIINLVIMRILYSTAFGNLGLDPVQMKTTLTKTVDVGGELLKATTEEVVGKAEVVFRDTIGQAQKVLDQMPPSSEAMQTGQEVLKQTTGVLAEKTSEVAQHTASQAKDMVVQTTGVARQKVTHLFGTLKSKVTAKKESVGDASTPDKTT